MGKSENDRLGTSGNMARVNSSPPKGGKENRREARYIVSWRVAVSIEGQSLHYGRAKDISLHGAAILNELNLKPGTRVTLNIHIPTFSRSCEQRVLVVHGMTAYTVYDADRLCFRTGISFVKFEQASDRSYLEERLASHHVQVPDYVCQRSTD